MDPKSEDEHREEQVECQKSNHPLREGPGRTELSSRGPKVGSGHAGLRDLHASGFHRRISVPGVGPSLVVPRITEDGAPGRRPVPDPEEVRPIPEDVAVAGVTEPKRALTHPRPGGGRSRRSDGDGL